MNFGELVNQGKKLAIDNAPTILTVVGAAGVVGTAYLTGKASFKAAQILGEESPHLNAKEKATLCWRLYIPAAGMGALTIAAIVGSNRIGTNRAAGLAAAYAISEKGFERYKAHVKEKFGENKAREVQDELAQKQVNENPPSSEMLIIGAGKVLCRDSWTGRYFHSTMETIKKAQNDINYKALADDYPSLTEFYQRIGLRPVSASDAVGWNSQNKLEVMFSAALVEPAEGQGTVPCMVISFVSEPIPNFWKASGY